MRRQAIETEKETALTSEHYSSGAISISVSLKQHGFPRRPLLGILRPVKSVGKGRPPPEAVFFLLCVLLRFAEWRLDSRAALWKQSTAMLWRVSSPRLYPTVSCSRTTAGISELSCRDAPRRHCRQSAQYRRRICHKNRRHPPLQRSPGLRTLHSGNAARDQTDRASADYPLV